MTHFNKQTKQKLIKLQCQKRYQLRWEEKLNFKDRGKKKKTGKKANQQIL
jgi:hypothetical protein